MVDEVPSKLSAYADFSSSSRFIGSAQYPRGAHRDRISMYIFIVMSVRACIYMSIYVYTVFKKKNNTILGKIISLSFACLLPTGAFSLGNIINMK